MIYLLKGNDINIVWGILKLIPGEVVSTMPEDFREAVLEVFLKSEYERVKVDYTLINEGKDIHIFIPGDTTKCGVYSLEASWSKNNNQNFASTKTEALFFITDQIALVNQTAIRNTYTLSFDTKVSYSVGYDGKGAYEQAVEGGYSGTKEAFIALLGKLEMKASVEVYQTLPPVGKEKVLYVVANKGLYVWVAEELRYVQVGFDYDVISGQF